MPGAVICYLVLYIVCQTGALLKAYLRLQRQRKIASDTMEKIFAKRRITELPKTMIFELIDRTSQFLFPDS